MTNRIQKIEKAINNMSDDKFNELLNELGVKEEKQWVPRYGEIYYLVLAGGSVRKDDWFGTKSDSHRLLMKNVFKTEKEALAQLNFNIEKAKLIKEIEDSSGVIDWEDGEQHKHSLYYTHYGKEIKIESCLTLEMQGTTYTTNREFLENLIKNEPERIKKYLFGIGV